MISEWKIWDGITGLSTDGISAGLNEFNKESYVGRGSYNGQLAPGKLVTEDTSAYKAGLYFPFGGDEHFLKNGVEYYAKEYECAYKWQPSSDGEIISDAVQFKSDPFTFYVGRAFELNSVQVGKVTLENKVMYYAYNGKEHSTSKYDVLVCEKLEILPGK